MARFTLSLGSGNLSQDEFQEGSKVYLPNWGPDFFRTAMCPCYLLLPNYSLFP